MLQSLRPAGAGVSRAEEAPFQAPLFNDLIAGLDQDKRHVVLDLGAASTATLALLGRSRCRVEIVDLAHFGGVERLNSAEPGDELASVAESLLPNRQTADPIDLVLCWDLPDYLSPKALAALMKAIGARTAPGALAHCITAYSDREMREQPGRFVPATDGALVNRNAAGDLIPAPRHSPDDLSSSMDRFVIDRARLLSNGMQEFLLRS